MSLSQEVPAEILNMEQSEAETNIQIISAHFLNEPSQHEEISNFITAAMYKIGALLIQARVSKDKRKLFLEEIQVMNLVLLDKDAEIKSLKAQLEQARSENESLLTKQTSEQRSTRKVSNQVLKAPQGPPTSFSGALKRVPTSKRKSKNISLVFIKNKDTSSEEVKDALSKALDPSKLSVGIKAVRKLAKGGLAIEGDSARATETILREVNKNAVLSANFEARRPKKRLPRFIMYNIDSSLSKEDVEATLLKQNEYMAKDDFKVLLNLKGKETITQHWIIETKPKLFQMLVKKKKVNGSVSL